MPEIVLADSFVESKCVLKSRDHRPISVADMYRVIAERLKADFSPTIRLLELLPVFLHGSRHAEVRRAMAINLSAARGQQEHAAQQVVDRLPELLAPGRSVELVEEFVRPLWDALASANGTRFAIDPGLSKKAARLFDDKSRLRERLEINEGLRRFIESEPDTADQRLIALGQNVLGATPLIGTMARSLHAMFSANLGKSLKDVCFPKRFPSSAVPATDRVPVDGSMNNAVLAHDVTRCVLNSPKFSSGENDEMLYGLGEHACLGRPIANAAWAMVTDKLASLDCTIRSSALTLVTDAPQTAEDLLAMNVLFIKPSSLRVEIGP